LSDDFRVSGDGNVLPVAEGAADKLKFDVLFDKLLYLKLFAVKFTCSLFQFIGVVTNLNVAFAAVNTFRRLDDAGKNIPLVQFSRIIGAN
jgi:hypothetical protein